MKEIYLIRHAQSEANVDMSVLRSKTNVGISLTSKGQKQVVETANFIDNHICSNLAGKKLKIWNSPYERTRATAEAIKVLLRSKNIDFLEEESIYIAERQLGLIDDAEDYSVTHPAEYNHYQLHTNAQHEYFVRPPLGESPFDMCMRLDFFLRNVIEPDCSHFVVSHGAAIRGLIMMQQKLKYEDYLKMPNPANASIIHIDSEGILQGQIFSPLNKTY